MSTLHKRNAVNLVYISRAQKDAISKDEQQQKAFLARRLQHAAEVKKQVRETEQQKINAKKAFFEEGIKLDQEGNKATNIPANTIALLCAVI